MSRVDGSRKPGSASVNAAWKAVEDILRNGEPSPETDALLLVQIKRLLAERDGLTVLSEYVRRRGPWRPGNPFLVLLTQSMAGASEAGISSNHADAFEMLVVAIIKTTDGDDRPHDVMLPILYRL